MTFPIRRGGMPRPVQIPPTVVELLVTNGPKVDVKHQRVRALNEDALACGQRLVHIYDTVDHERA
jgi:hypothetical protein